MKLAADIHWTSVGVILLAGIFNFRGYRKEILLAIALYALVIAVIVLSLLVYVLIAGEFSLLNL